MALGSVLTFAQAVSGNIVGTVTDSSGAAVVGAEVVATKVATGVSATSKTSNSGEYRFDNLLAGTYRVTARSSGFRTTSVIAEVLLNQTGTVNVTLSPGASTETVEVSGEAPIIDTTTAQLQTTYEDRQLLDLPTSGLGVSTNGQNLGVLNLALLDSGVGSTGGLGAGTGPSVGGQRPRNNNFTVEGVDNNNKGITGPLIYVPQDAVANFSVLQNQFNSEFGHSSGGQFNLAVQSGTNSFHGKAYEYFQNRNMNAVDTSLANQGIFKNPRFDSNRFGGQFGGPIFKNKLFFFANFEYNPVGQAASPGSPLLAPTDGWLCPVACHSGSFGGQYQRPEELRGRTLGQQHRHSGGNTSRGRRFPTGGAELHQLSGADHFDGLQHQRERPDSRPVSLQQKRADRCWTHRRDSARFLHHS